MPATEAEPTLHMTPAARHAAHRAAEAGMTVAEHRRFEQLRRAQRERAEALARTCDAALTDLIVALFTRGLPAEAIPGHVEAARELIRDAWDENAQWLENDLTLIGDDNA